MKIAKEATERFSDYPGVSRYILDLKRELHNGAREEPQKDRVVVQVHGDFKPEHIFVANGVTTVIDFDRSGPADPALDIATFVCGVRQQLFNVTGDSARAELPTRVFLGEYVSSLPDYVGNLPSYWRSQTLAFLVKGTRRPARSAAFESRIRYHIEEFEYAGKVLGICE